MLAIIEVLARYMCVMQSKFTTPPPIFFFKPQGACPVHPSLICLIGSAIALHIHVGISQLRIRRLLLYS